ncbi:DJ-1/PfpI family protein [Salinarimonas ramus]|uniref:Glutamine amidotransferase n=1 Tax=Salinarimonas ramus TaxID=690164 RepID=A0A917Q5V0_9HYPH|nr:DJ-1/PfpI family protein [Salinarimonas ramus]GGK27831.1 glutamine amidotransferase [Salinarimonas ramus]
MSEDLHRRIAVLLPDGFADWEVGMLAASAREQFGADIRYLTPTGEDVVSIGGLRARADGRFGEASEAAPDALVVCGSDAWVTGDLDIAPLLRAEYERGTVVAVICAATVQAARAGLFADRAHTSNGRAWLLDVVPGYAGADHYREGGEAVCDRRVVSAPGTAPATFAAETMALLYPGAPGLEETLAMLRAAR